MTKKKVKKVKPIGGAVIKSRRLARQITSKYHQLQNEQASIKQSVDLEPKEKQHRIHQLEEQLNKIGGRVKYQQASIINTNLFKTSKWILSVLQQLEMKPIPPQRLEVFEIGAVNIQLQECKWLNVHAIDLHSQHPAIKEQDFFDVEPKQLYDVVVCCMVINCVDEAPRRGEMLIRLAMHLKNETSILLLILPSRCVNSKHIGRIQSFTMLLKALGLIEIISMRRITPKLTFFVLKRNINLGNIHNHNIDYDEDKKKKQKVYYESWEDCMKYYLAKTFTSSLREIYSKNYNHIPSNEFTISLPIKFITES